MLNVDALEGWEFPLLEQRYTADQTMLYAATLGFGQDPLSAGQLRFVYEKELAAVPTFAAILCHPGRWTAAPELGVTLTKTVHGEQRVFLHKPLPPEGDLVARARVHAVQDKGEKGALIHAARTLYDRAGGDPVASILHSTFCRADGGFGREFGTVPKAEPLPERAPDVVVDIETRPEAAVLYRLNKDRNPLHIDPEYAARAGFERPILHGLCTWGLAARAMLEGVLEHDETGLRSIEARFSRPVFPGETVRFLIWREDGLCRFRARVEARDVTVLEAGRCLMGAGHDAPAYMVPA
ncbi:MAG: MaoC family dehydratase N-terminal domain-containing protein [Vannielia sp.]|uniref:MaoC family dehydratase n=1 Tax=Vannielia sp. TaxID=2813045 RepID=UPI003B8E40BD